MTAYEGRVAIGTAEVSLSIDDLDAADWSAELGDVRPTVVVRSGVFMVRLLDGPRTDQQAPATLEMLLPSGVSFVVGTRPFAGSGR